MTMNGGLQSCNFHAFQVTLEDKFVDHFTPACHLNRIDLKIFEARRYVDDAHIHRFPQLRGLLCWFMIFSRWSHMSILQTLFKWTIFDFPGAGDVGTIIQFQKYFVEKVLGHWEPNILQRRQQNYNHRQIARSGFLDFSAAQQMRRQEMHHCILFSLLKGGMFPALEHAVSNIFGLYIFLQVRSKNCFSTLAPDLSAQPF